MTKQQMDERWDILPINLREILCSPEQGKIIWGIGKNNHLIDEKIGKIVGLTSYVVMGFIHPEDLSKEIKETLNINSEIANAIYREIDKKIFAPIRSEIDKIYSPIEISAKESVLSTVVEKKESIVDLRIFEKQKSEEEIKKLIEIKEEIIEKPAEVVEAKKLETEGFHVVSEAEPMIIHKEADFAPTLGAKRSLGGLFNFLGKKEGAAGPVAVEVDFEPSITEAPKQTVIRPEAPKMVHYSDLKTSVAAPEIKPIPQVPLPTPKVESSKIEIPKPEIEISKETKNEEVKKAEIKKESFFGKIGKFISGLFTTKQKILKEIEVDIPLPSKTILPPKPLAEAQAEALKQKPKESILMKKFDVKAPIEMFRVKFKSEEKKPVEIKPAVEIKPPVPEVKVLEIKTPEVEIPIPENKGVREALIIDAKKDFKEEKPAFQSTAPKPPAPSANEEVIDLRTFQKITNN